MLEMLLSYRDEGREGGGRTRYLCLVYHCTPVSFICILVVDLWLCHSEIMP
jgi:hypothetical protein